MPGSSKHASIILLKPTTLIVVRSIRFELTISRLRWGRCPDYPDFTWEKGPDGIPHCHLTLVVVTWMLLPFLRGIRAECIEQKTSSHETTLILFTSVFSISKSHFLWSRFILWFYLYLAANYQYSICWSTIISWLMISSVNNQRHCQQPRILRTFPDSLLS